MLDTTNGWYVDVGNHDRVPPLSVSYGPFQTIEDADTYAISRGYSTMRVFKMNEVTIQGIPLKENK